MPSLDISISEGYDSGMIALLGVRLVSHVINEALVIANAAEESGQPWQYLAMKRNLQPDNFTGIADERIFFEASKRDGVMEKNCDQGSNIITSTPQKNKAADETPNQKPENSFIGQGDEDFDMSNDDVDNCSTSIFINKLFDMSNVDKVCDDEETIQIDSLGPDLLSQAMTKIMDSYVNTAFNIALDQDPLPKIVELQDNPLKQVTEIQYHPLTQIADIHEQSLTQVAKIHSNPLTQFTEMEDHPLVEVTEIQEYPLTKVSEIQDPPLTPVTEIQDHPLTQVKEIQDNPVTQVTEIQNHPHTPITEVQDHQLTLITEMKDHLLTKLIEIEYNEKLEAAKHAEQTCLTFLAEALSGNLSRDIEDINDDNPSTDEEKIIQVLEEDDGIPPEIVIEEIIDEQSGIRDVIIIEEYTTDSQDENNSIPKETTIHFEEPLEGDVVVIEADVNDTFEKNDVVQYGNMYSTLNRDYEQCSEEDEPVHRILQNTDEMMTMQEIELMNADISEENLCPKPDVKEEDPRELAATSNVSALSGKSSLSKRFRSRGARLLSCLRGWWRRKTPGKRKEKLHRNHGSMHGLCPLSPDARRLAASLLDQRKYSPTSSRPTFWKFNTINETVVNKDRYKDYTFDKTEECKE